MTVDQQPPEDREEPRDVAARRSITSDSGQDRTRTKTVLNGGVAPSPVRRSDRARCRHSNKSGASGRCTIRSLRITANSTNPRKPWQIRCTTKRGWG